SDRKQISTKGLNAAFPQSPGGAGKPEIITSQAQLAKSPALKGAEAEIRKRVNFEKEKLVFIAWNGSCSDRFSIEPKVIDEKFVVSFKVTPGPLTDLYK